MRTFDVHYQYATYSGTTRVQATDAEHAIALAKRRLRPFMTLPMAYERWDAEEVG